MDITVEQFTAALEEVVAERGEDFVYPKEWKADLGTQVPSCQYFLKDGYPACIIGATAAKLGFSREDFLAVAPDQNVDAKEMLEAIGIINPVIRDSAVQAQMSQDNGETWGMALEEYKFNIAEFGR